MKIKYLIAIVFAVFTLGGISSGQAPDAAALIAAQKEAFRPLSYMFGVWRGPAETVMPDGSKHAVIQTERIGPFLDGSVIVLEGRGYDSATGKVTFNAFGTISYSVRTEGFTLHSYAQGQAGDFTLTPIADGYMWEIPAGPIVIRYTAIIKNGAWREVGDRIAPGKDPVRFFEMNLKRVGDTDWPAGGAVPMK
jgi:hypothetical protein